MNVTVLHRLRTHLNQASVRPWYADTMPESHYVLNYDPDDNEARFQPGNHVICGMFVSGTNPNREADRALIVELVNHAHQLLAAVEAAQEMADWLARFTPEPEVGKPGFAVRRRLRAALAPLNPPTDA